MEIKNIHNTATENQVYIINLIEIVFSSINILFIFFCFIIFGMYSKIRTFAVEFIIYICVCELICNIINLIPTGDSASFSCRLQSFSEIMFPMISMIIMSFINYTAFKSIFNEKDDYIKLKRFYRIVVLSTSSFIGIVYSLM